MAIDDLWFSSRQRDPVTDKPLPTGRHGRGKRWRVRFEDDAGAKVERLFDRKPDAEDFDAEVRSAVRRGVYVDQSAGKVLVKDYAAEWRAAQIHRQSTVEQVERGFRRHINPVLGDRPIASVRPTMIQQWVKGLDLAPSAARVIYSYVSSMFGAAARDRIIGVSPCVGIKLPETPDSDHLILTPTQVHTLADTVPARFRAAVLLGAGCGLRISETLGLELSSIDFLRRELHVRQQLAVVARQPAHLGPPKTRTSRRTVELPKIVADALALHIQTCPPVARPMRDAVDPRRVSERPVKLLFTRATTGQPLRRADWSKLWRPAADAADLPARAGYHLLRHYFASLLIFGGASVKTVQVALGHSTPMVTLNVYTGLWPDQIDRTRTLVDDALGAVARAVESR